MRALFTTWEGGGHVPPALLVAKRMQSEGAEILFVSDEATRAAAVAHGLAFRPWASAPNRQRQGEASDPLTDWKARTPLGVVKAICRSVICGPAALYAADTLALIEDFRPHLVVTNELLFGVLVATERARVPTALLTGNLWCFPTRADLPPFGPAFAPARTRFEQSREQAARGLIARLYNVGLADLNRARAALDLPPLKACLDQLGKAGLTVLGVARAFDYGDTTPADVVYAGPLGTTPAWARPDPIAVGADDPRPLILASFSTTYQGEEALARRCLDALSRLPVRGILTRGPALARARLSGPVNVEVVDALSHDQIVPQCAAVICHGGHGTVMRPLMHGVPVIALPTGRDQPENARRIALKGAGLMLPRRARASRIEQAIRRVLSDPSYSASAQSWGRAIAAEADDGLRAARALATFGRGSA